MAEGQFREDLYFRLNVVCITLPPLRQRRDEIRRSRTSSSSTTREHYNKPPIALMATDTLRLFAEYDWPGNVRELENLIKRAVVLGSDESPCAASWPRRSPARDCAPARFPCSQPRADTAAAPWRRPRPPPAGTGRPATAAPPAVLRGSLKDIAPHAAREAERELIYRTLQQTRWNRREAAEILGISYKALLYKIKEAELDKAS